MIILEDTITSLVVVTSSTSTTNFVVSYADLTATTLTGGGNHGSIAAATTTTLLAAPAASTQRQVKQISISNRGTAVQTILVHKQVSGINYQLARAVLAPNETLQFDGSWTRVRADGRVATDEDRSAGYINATSYSFIKPGNATEAAGLLHSLHSVSGFPGAWSPGTPGVNGRATDGTQAADNGCIPVKSPTTGSNYLTCFQAAASVVCAPLLYDFLWINTGLVVTQTTIQAISAVALPARDSNGATLGEDVQAGILVTGNTTNGSAVTTITGKYTSSAGDTNQDMSIASFPATCQVGAIIPFRLAAGHKGVRAIESITLGTTLGGGSISLVLFRILAQAAAPVVNVGGLWTPASGSALTKLHPGVCLIPGYLASGTSATNLQGLICVEER